MGFLLSTNDIFPMPLSLLLHLPVTFLRDSNKPKMTEVTQWKLILFYIIFDCIIMLLVVVCFMANFDGKSPQNATKSEVSFTHFKQKPHCRVIRNEIVHCS